MVRRARRRHDNAAADRDRYQTINDADGRGGYAITSVRSGARVRREQRTLRARGVVVAAGALGTNRLLQRCKLNGSLPNISDRLGYLVRTNSESNMAVTAPADYPEDFTKSIAITSSIYIDPETHIEVVTYGEGGDSQSRLFAMMVQAAKRGTQPLHFLAGAARHPRTALNAARIGDWSRRTIILLVKQSSENSMRLKVKRRLPGGSVILTTEQDPNNPNPVGLPAALRWQRRASWSPASVCGRPRAHVLANTGPPERTLPLGSV